ncbi:MAG: cupredoxin domain-containing protein [Deltaproteobacteria bacterium]|nr:cupredoxin domain-containing protein [Deltaproteobacteria bacterium]
MKVEPCTGESATVTNNASAFIPMTTTISQGQIVKFVMSDLDHNVQPNALPPTDPGLNVGYGATTCLRFTQSGTFKFACGMHFFGGTITVN